MQTFLSTISAIGGIAGIISLIALLKDIQNNRFLAVHEFLSGIDDPDFIQARAAVYEHKDAVDANDKEMATVVNFFHHWGLLAKKHYLPLWVFDEGSGAGTIRLYEKSKKYIALRREGQHDNTYGSGFVWLYETLEKRTRRKDNV